MKALFKIAVLFFLFVTCFFTAQVGFADFGSSVTKVKVRASKLSKKKINNMPGLDYSHGCSAEKLSYLDSTLPLEYNPPTISCGNSPFIKWEKMPKGVKRIVVFMYMMEEFSSRPHYYYADFAVINLAPTTTTLKAGALGSSEKSGLNIPVTVVNLREGYTYIGPLNRSADLSNIAHLHIDNQGALKLLPGYENSEGSSDENPDIGNSLDITVRIDVYGLSRDITATELDSFSAAGDGSTLYKALNNNNGTLHSLVRAFGQLKLNKLVNEELICLNKKANYFDWVCSAHGSCQCTVSQISCEKQSGQYACDTLGNCGCLLKPEYEQNEDNEFTLCGTKSINCDPDKKLCNCK